MSKVQVSLNDGKSYSNNESHGNFDEAILMSNFRELNRGSSAITSKFPVKFSGDKSGGVSNSFLFAPLKVLYGQSARVSNAINPIKPTSHIFFLAWRNPSRIRLSLMRHRKVQLIIEALNFLPRYLNRGKRIDKSQSIFAKFDLRTYKPVVNGQSNGNRPRQGTKALLVSQVKKGLRNEEQQKGNCDGKVQSIYARPVGLNLHLALRFFENPIKKWTLAS
ncbi:MAG: hypothetical protein RLZZ12_753 [Actinomycetota bacterium]